MSYLEYANRWQNIQSQNVEKQNIEEAKYRTGKKSKKKISKAQNVEKFLIYIKEKI